MGEIDTCEDIGNTVVVKLNRRLVIQKHLLKGQALKRSESSVVEIINFDLGEPNTSELTSKRSEALCESLKNLPHDINTIVGVSSKNLTEQIQKLEADLDSKSPIIGVRVGSVLGENGQKDVSTSFEELKEMILEEIRELDDERRDEYEDDEITEKRLSILVNSSLRFTFLGANISNPVQIISKAQKLQKTNLEHSSLTNHNQSSSFVLYNLARMKKIIRTFDECVIRGEYPGLPSAQDLNLISSLISEPEEWELMFNFILNFQNVLSQCSKSLCLSKLVIFLCGLSSTFSRYYSRVKILKDPLPHLIPSVHARIFFVSSLCDVAIEALRILNINYIPSM